MDIDLIMSCLRETSPEAFFLGLRSPEYYNLPQSTKLFSLMGNLTFYYVIVFFYAKITDPNITSIAPTVAPIIGDAVNIVPKPSIDTLLETFEKSAHKLMLKNNGPILRIAFDQLLIIEEFSKKIGPDQMFDMNKLADVYKDMIIDAIKENKKLYTKLHHNDLVVKYIGSVCREGFLTDTMTKVLGFEDIHVDFTINKK